MTTILVTGGRHRQSRLQALAVPVYPVVYDNLVRGNDWAVKQSAGISDIADRARLDAVIAEYKPAATITSPVAYVGESVADPEVLSQQRPWGVEPLEALRDHRRGPIVFHDRATAAFQR